MTDNPKARLKNSPANRNIKFDLEAWDVKLQERKRNRMKLTIKLDKQESEAFKSFAETVKPAEISDQQFLKSIFLYGIEAVNTQLTEAVKQFAEENKDELAASGITFDTSGDVATFMEIESEGSVDIVDSSEEE